MKIRFLLIFISMSLGGCSLIYSYSDDLPQRLDQWVAEKKYNTALDTISYIKPKHKDYRLIQRKKKTILKKMAAYEKSGIKKSSELAKKGYWLQGISLLDEISENVSDTIKIDTHRVKLLKQREKVIDRFEIAVLNIQANNLANNIELYSKIKKTVHKSESNELDIAEFDELRQETSLRLAKRSEVQYQKGQYANALTTIDLALKLHPDNDIAATLAKIKNKIKRTTKQKKKQYINETKDLLSKLSQGYSHNILKEAKEKIIWLDKIKGNDKDYQKHISKLKRHLKAGIKQNFEAARKLYSKGKTQEALSIWIDLKELDPEHPKLQAYIIRAEKVLRKLKKLTNKPAKK